MDLVTMPTQGKDLGADDRALLRHVTRIEAELAEIDRELDEHGGDASTGEQL
jgi:hypothetical protein